MALALATVHSLLNGRDQIRSNGFRYTDPDNVAKTIYPFKQLVQDNILAFAPVVLMLGSCTAWGLYVGGCTRVHRLKENHTHESHENHESEPKEPKKDQ